MERDPIAIGQHRRAPLSAMPARSIACLAGAWGDSGGGSSLGAVTEGFSGDSATHQLFATLSTRLAGGRHAAAGRAAFDLAPPAMAAALDRINVALCAFDADDRTALWNDTYLRFFPEHAGFIHQGEPYRANLRRFYTVRLEAEELGLLERYVEEGVARCADEQAPQAFSHRGFWLQASEQSGPGGRVCLWTRTPGAVPVSAKGDLDGPGMVGLASGLDLFEHVGEGIVLTDGQGRIGWVNEAFVAMYRLGDKARALQGDLIDVYLAAWRGADPSERGRFESGLAMLEENLSFAGAPFELPLPSDRWVRVVEQRRPDGFACFAHVDISMLKRRQQRLLQAEERARAACAQAARKSALVDAMLDRLDAGIVMVDAQGIVEVCNRRAVEMLGLPEALMASRPAFDEIRALHWVRTAEDDRDLVSSAGSERRPPRRLERRQPDGRVVAVASVALAGGAVLHTFRETPSD